MSTPRVSIGLPVYNGEQYLEAALRSLLEQTFTDFEVVVCDNASSDGTQQVAEGLARADRRIRYHRNPENIGAAPNFNRVLALANGRYFKWAAHDDRLAPTFLSRCVEVLDANPDVVLAYPEVEITSVDGQVVGRFRTDLPTDSPDPAVRFGALLSPHECYEIFGLIRRSALDRTPGMGLYAHGDGILLARLALHGRFFQIPEPLFIWRRHPDQSMARFKDYRSYAVWFNPALAGKRVFPYWRMTVEQGRSLLQTNLTAADRVRCLAALATEVRHRRHRLRQDVEHHLRDLLGKPRAEAR